MIPEIESLTWSEPRTVERIGKTLKSATPSEGFWALWREFKPQLQDAGFSISKFREQWQVAWWQKEGVFKYPVLPEVTHDQELKLEPLVNETVLKEFQKPLVQMVVAASKLGQDKLDDTLNAAGTGVGKTFITLGAARELNQRLIVICPKVIVVDWIRSAHLMGVQLAGVYGWEWIKTGKTPFGSFDITQTTNKKTGKVTKRKGTTFTWSVPDDCAIVFDEAHRASGIGTQNSLMLSSAKDAKHTIYMLSASIANSPIKMQAPGYVLGLHKNGKDFYDWMYRHGVVDQTFKINGRMVTVQKFKGSARHLQTIHRSIFPRKGIRITAEELGDQFPSTQINAKAFQLDDAKKVIEVYEELEEKLAILATMRGPDKQANILTETLRARMKIEMLKIPIFVSLTRDAEEEGNSVFIAVNFKDTLHELVKQLKIQAWVMGGQKEHDRRNMIDDFQANRVNKIIGIMGACREGMNLQDLHGGHPRYAIISPPEDPNSLRQVTGRVARIGGTPSNQVIPFVEGTIEEQVCKNLSTKLDQLDLIMDGDLSPSFFPSNYSKMRAEQVKQGKASQEPTEESMFQMQEAREEEQF